MFCTASSSLDARVLESYSEIVDAVLPGVVNIRATQIKRERDAKLDPYEFFLKGRLPRSAVTHSLGSGIIVDTEGRILTNHHVIDGAEKIEVLVTKTKRMVSAVVVGSDIKTDLALLQLKIDKNLVPLDLGDSDKLKVGDIVLAIGNPFGFAHTVTSGIISAKGRVIGTGPSDDFLQTDAPIHPGNSGGPLIDMRGRVIGINTAVWANGNGIGFAIPINTAKDVIEDLKKHGKVIRPWLGIVGKNILSTEDVGDAYDPTGVYGVIIENLIVDGPAHKAGLKTGDLIMGLDGEKVFDMNHLQKLLGKKSPADRISVKLFRRGKGFMTLPVSLSAIPNAKDLPAEKDLF